MKNILIQSIIFIAIAISANAQQQTGQPNNDCTDLFITELTFGKNPKANNTFDLNYAIEIFNSSNTAINLANYSLDLATSAGVISSIPLTGSLASHDVFVIGNSNADLNLQGLCDQLSGDLEFELNVSLELKKGSNVIDRLGLGGTSIPQPFDIAQFASDPYTYLQNFHLDLNDYQNIDIRRSLLTTHGNPNFNSSNDIIGQWYYTFNVDRSDIGSYTGVCSKPTRATIGFSILEQEFDPCIGGGYFNDPLFIDNPSNGTGNITYDVIASSTTATIGFNSNFKFGFNGGATTTSTCYSGGLGCESIQNGTVPSAIDVQATIQLSSSDFTIDPARNLHLTKVKGCIPQAVKNILNDNDLKIKSNNLTYIIFESQNECNINFYNIYGKTIMTKKILKGENYLDINFLSSGMYIVNCISLSDNKNLVNFKFIKN